MSSIFKWIWTLPRGVFRFFVGRRAPDLIALIGLTDSGKSAFLVALNEQREDITGWTKDYRQDRINDYVQRIRRKAPNGELLWSATVETVFVPFFTAIRRVLRFLPAAFRTDYGIALQDARGEIFSMIANPLLIDNPKKRKEVFQVLMHLRYSRAIVALVNPLPPRRPDGLDLSLRTKNQLADLWSVMNKLRDPKFFQERFEAVQEDLRRRDELREQGVVELEVPGLLAPDPEREELNTLDDAYEGYATSIDDMDGFLPQGIHLRDLRQEQRQWRDPLIVTLAITKADMLLDREIVLKPGDSARFRYFLERNLDPFLAGIERRRREVNGETQDEIRYGLRDALGRGNVPQGSWLHDPAHLKAVTRDYMSRHDPALAKLIDEINKNESGIKIHALLMSSWGRSLKPASPLGGEPQEFFPGVAGNVIDPICHTEPIRDVLARLWRIDRKKSVRRRTAALASCCIALALAGPISLLGIVAWARHDIRAERPDAAVRTLDLAADHHPYVYLNKKPAPNLFEPLAEAYVEAAGVYRAQGPKSPAELDEGLKAIGKAIELAGDGKDGKYKTACQDHILDSVDSWVKAKRTGEALAALADHAHLLVTSDRVKTTAITVVGASCAEVETLIGKVVNSDRRQIEPAEHRKAEKLLDATRKGIDRLAVLQTPIEQSKARLGAAHALLAMALPGKEPVPPIPLDTFITTIREIQAAAAVLQKSPTSNDREAFTPLRKKALAVGLGATGISLNPEDARKTPPATTKAQLKRLLDLGGMTPSSKGKSTSKGKSDSKENKGNDEIRLRVKTRLASYADDLWCGLKKTLPEYGQLPSVLRFLQDYQINGHGSSPALDAAEVIGKLQKMQVSVETQRSLPEVGQLSPLLAPIGDKNPLVLSIPKQLEWNLTENLKEVRKALCGAVSKAFPGGEATIGDWYHIARLLEKDCDMTDQLFESRMRIEFEDTNDGCKPTHTQAELVESVFAQGETYDHIDEMMVTIGRQLSKNVQTVPGAFAYRRCLDDLAGEFGDPQALDYQVNKAKRLEKIIAGFRENLYKAPGKTENLRRLGGCLLDKLAIPVAQDDLAWLIDESLKPDAMPHIAELAVKAVQILVREHIGEAALKNLTAALLSLVEKGDTKAMIEMLGRYQAIVTPPPSLDFVLRLARLRLLLEDSNQGNIEKVSDETAAFARLRALQDAEVSRVLSERLKRASATDADRVLAVRRALVKAAPGEDRENLKMLLNTIHGWIVDPPLLEDSALHQKIMADYVDVLSGEPGGSERLSDLYLRARASQAKGYLTGNVGKICTAIAPFPERELLFRNDLAEKLPQSPGVEQLEPIQPELIDLARKAGARKALAAMEAINQHLKWRNEMGFKFACIVPSEGTPFYLTEDEVSIGQYRKLLEQNQSLEISYYHGADDRAGKMTFTLSGPDAAYLDGVKEVEDAGVFAVDPKTVKNALAAMSARLPTVTEWNQVYRDMTRRHQSTPELPASDDSESEKNKRECARTGADMQRLKDVTERTGIRGLTFGLRELVWDESTKLFAAMGTSWYRHGAADLTKITQPSYISGDADRYDLGFRIGLDPLPKELLEYRSLLDVQKGAH